jgi:phage FluMu protein Com
MIDTDGAPHCKRCGKKVGLKLHGVLEFKCPRCGEPNRISNYDISLSADQTLTKRGNIVVRT